MVRGSCDPSTIVRFDDTLRATGVTRREERDGEAVRAHGHLATHAARRSRVMRSIAPMVYPRRVARGHGLGLTRFNGHRFMGC
jgi:hypothetical protein